MKFVLDVVIVGIVFYVAKWGKSKFIKKRGKEIKPFSLGILAFWLVVYVGLILFLHEVNKLF